MIFDEVEKIRVELLSVGEVEAVRRVFIDKQAAVRHQFSRAGAGQRQRCGGVGVALHDECGDRDPR